MSRAIDAVQALNNINWYHRPTPVSQFDSGFNQVLNQAMWEITHAPTLTPQNEWVSVNEQLPRKRSRVLCYFEFEPESPDVICENLYIGSGRWQSESDRVTHWMPLPAPPDRRPPERQEDT